MGSRESKNGRKPIVYSWGRSFLRFEAGSKYVAVFNRGDTEKTVDLPWSKVGVDWSSPVIRDLWQHKDQNRAAAMHITLRPHVSVLYKVSR